MLQNQSLVHWVRDRRTITGHGDRYPYGTRGFQPVDGREAPMAGRTQVKGPSTGQSLVQQMYLAGHDGVDRDLANRTVTVFSGVSGPGTAAAVKEFLSGWMNWQWIIGELNERAKGKRGAAMGAWPVTWAHWWARNVEDVDSEKIDFDPKGGPAAKSDPYKILISASRRGDRTGDGAQLD